MKVIIVAHPSRAHHVARLQDCLPVMTTVIDTVSAKSGHLSALRIASQLSERVAIMEDDAIPIRDFEALSDWWDMRRPDDLLSFYLGTSRPRQFQPMISERMNRADRRGDADIWLPTLIHGVCYSIPRHGVADVLARTEMLDRVLEADFAVGAAWGMPVCYPIESLVQHRDEAPVERHPDGQARSEPRVARRLAGNLMFTS